MRIGKIFYAAARTAESAAGQTSQDIRLHVYEARISFDWMCKDAGIGGDLRQRLRKAMTLDQPLGRALPGRKRALDEGLDLLRTLFREKALQPKQTVRQRQAFARHWLRLRARGNGSHLAWIRLAKNPRFWSRLNDEQRATAAGTLSRVRANAAKVVAMIGRIIDHHLFKEATAEGKKSALTHVHLAHQHVTQTLLPFPSRGLVIRTAPHWKAKHLGRMTPEAADDIHQKVLLNVQWYRAHYFELIPKTDPPRMWGDNYTQAFGNDWYRSSLSINRQRNQRNACRSAYKMAGVYRGADRVCGHAY